MTTIGFAGMTHLGINSAIATAERGVMRTHSVYSSDSSDSSSSHSVHSGFNIICYDENPIVIQSLKQKSPPIFEPDCTELLTKNFKQFYFSSDPRSLIGCDVVYVSPDVPTNDHGQSDLTGINALIQTIIPFLNPQAILVILCQVPPGFTRKISKSDFLPKQDVLSSNSKSFSSKLSVSPESSISSVSDIVPSPTIPLDRLFYQVETLIFGRAIERALYPERFIVGAANPNQPLPSAYRNLLEAFECPILPMRYESAELAKISINCCLVASVGVANTLSEICEKIGADWHEIIPALKLDKRIGPHAYLSPGLGLAGGNLERDLATVVQLSQNYGTESSIVNAWIKNSHYRKDWVLRTFHQVVLPNFFRKSSKSIPKSPNSIPNNPSITILGLAYKENTHSTKNSAALALLPALSSFPVTVFDPVVRTLENKSSFHDRSNLHFAPSAKLAIQNAQILIIMTPWPEFKQFTSDFLSQEMPGRVIIDPYRLLEGRRLQESGFNYFTIGTPSLCQTQP